MASEAIIKQSIFTEKIINYLAFVTTPLSLFIGFAPFFSEDLSKVPGNFFGYYVAMVISLVVLGVMYWGLLSKITDRKQDFNQLFFTYEPKRFENEVIKLFDECELSVDYFGAANFLNSDRYTTILKRILNSDSIEFRRYVNIMSLEDFDDYLTKNHNPNREQLINDYKSWVEKQMKTLEEKKLRKAEQNKNMFSQNNHEKEELEKVVLKMNQNPENWTTEISMLQERIKLLEDKDNNFFIDLASAPSWRWGVHIIVIDKKHTVFCFNDGIGNIGMVLKNNEQFGSKICESFLTMVKNIRNTSVVSGESVETLRGKLFATSNASNTETTYSS